MLTIQDMHDLLMRVTFPATPEEMAETLRRAEAPEEAIARVSNLPEHRYGSVDAVVDTLRGLE